MSPEQREHDVPIRRYRELLGRYLGPQRGRASLLAALLLVTIALQLTGPQLLRSFIDAVTGSAPLDGAVWIAGAFLALALAQQAATVAATFMSESVGWTATNALRADLALHCLRLDLGFHTARTPGEMIERIDGDVNALANFFSQLVIRVLGNALLLLGVLGLMCREDWRLGAAFALFAVVALAALNGVRGVAVPYFKAARQISAEVIGFVEERLSGTEDIRANGFVPHVLRRYFILARERLRRHRRSAFMGSLMFSANQAVFTFGYLIAFTLGTLLFGQGAITLGTVYLVLHYTELLQRPLTQLTQQLEDLQKASASMARIDDLLRLESAVPDGRGAPVPAGALAVELDGVSFAYGGDEAVLHDVSYRLEPGRVLGLLGRTGSGKTTLTRLLARFYDVTAGVVRVGDVDVRLPHLATLRSRIGMVTQDVQLFHATVRENLTFFRRDVPDARILDAIERLGLAAWLGALPQGLDTPLAAGAAGLSAGEAQLLAFTRVFLRDPGLVILDEASSRLDPATERLVEGAVDHLLTGRTGIVIAHHLSTVQRAHEILLLEDGRIVEHGKRAALAAAPDSRFHGLLRTGLELALA